MNPVYRLTWYQSDKTNGFETCSSEDAALRRAKRIVASGRTRAVTITKVEKVVVVRHSYSRDVYVEVEEL